MLIKIKDVTKFLIAYIWSLFLKRKEIWIITERRNECKDNGYHLFKYIRTNHPEINVYYAIDKGSEQREKIKAFNNILDFNSIRHYAYALAAKNLIGAFLPCGIPDSLCFYKFGDKLVKGKKCFLQHGIIKEKIKSLMFENTGLDMFICGAKPEFEYVNDNFGYPSGYVKYTGLARFDALENKVPEYKFILLMPTWRQYLSSQTWGKREEYFQETEYFCTFSNLLSNKNLIDLLEKNNINLIFYPHHEIQGNLSLFKAYSKHICIASEKEYDVQNLLKEASLLITDYSSVAFDFAYMDKPVLYYQFDEDEYYSKHYAKGYFDYEKMGFGAVCKEEAILIERIEEILNNNFQNNQKFQKRSAEFFELRDHENCKRIYDEIKNL